MKKLIEICNGQGYENICMPEKGITHTCQNIKIGAQEWHQEAMYNQPKG